MACWPPCCLPYYPAALSFWQEIHQRYLGRPFSPPPLPALRRADSALSAIARALGEHGLSLPAQVRAFYRMAPHDLSAFPSLFGFRQFYDAVLDFSPLPLDVVLSAASTFARRSGVLPLAHSGGILLCLHPASGRLLQSSPLGFVPLADSLFAHLAALSAMPVHPRKRCRELWPAEGRVSATTRGVRVDAVPAYAPEHSREGGHLFAYRIELRMAAEEDPAAACRLLRRRWEIEDAEGGVEVVEGPGVIGLYPECTPGMAVFSYASCSVMATPTGKMRGQFLMTVLATGEEFQCQVPEMTFKMIPSIELSQNIK